MNWFIVILAFCVGSIPFSYIITKIFAGKDITKLGSGNAGATNVVRALNIKYGIAVLLLDVAKGFFPVYFTGKLTDASVMVPIVALAVVLGHDYSPFLKFKGGKGVAATLGIFFAINPVITFIVLFVFAVIVYIFKFISLGSIIGAFLFPVLLYFSGVTFYVGLTFILAGLIGLKHHKNIKRLLNGEEKKAF